MDLSEKIKEENRKIRYLQLMVDLSLNIIESSNLSLEEAFSIVEKVKNMSISMFPGKEEAFDIIYRPKFERMIRKVFGKNKI